MLILRVYAEMKEWNAAEFEISYRQAIFPPPGWRVFSLTPYLDEPLMAWHRSLLPGIAFNPRILACEYFVLLERALLYFVLLLRLLHPPSAPRLQRSFCTPSL
jgi:hypothetical protein